MNNTPELIEQVKASLVNLETHNCDLQQRAKDLAKEAQTAIELYLADFAQRKEAVKNKIAKLDQEISAITISIRKLYASISDTAMADNFDAMKAARAEVKKKEARKADLEFQLTAIKNGQIKGNPELLASAKKKYEAYLFADKEFAESKRELCSFARQHESEFERLYNRRQYATGGYAPNIGALNDCICIAVCDI